MTDEIRANINGIELLFWGGHEFSQGSPLVYELSVNGEPVGGEHFDRNPVAFRDSFLVARRAHGFLQYGFAIYWFDPKAHLLKRVSKVRPFLSLRSVDKGGVEAATKGYGDGDVKRITITV
jgi:hypothetical protein